MRRAKHSRLFSCTVLAVLCVVPLLALTATADQLTAPEPVIVEVAIRARQFEPTQVSLAAGRMVRLVFKNQDAELHAFVPIRFLEHVPLQVDGNGAAEFGDSGLVRVLIPSGGRAEIQFIPQSSGSYTYRCDLPGHQMIGQIVVE